MAWSFWKKTKSVQLAHLPQWCIEQPPLGIAYLTGFLKDRGYEVRQVDYSVKLYRELPDNLKHLSESSFHLNWLNENAFYKNVFPIVKPWIENWARELARSKSPVIGFTMLSTSRIATLLTIERIKQLAPDKFIVIGGPHVTRYEGAPEVAKHPCVDLIIPDEGEEVFFDALEAYFAGRPLEQVPGLLIPDRQGGYKDTGQRQLISNINELPKPIFNGFDLSHYRSLTLPVLGSRGCIYSCSFCSETIFWRRYRYRTGENLFQEFKFQVESTGVRTFYIVDSLINGNIKELESFCDLVIASGLQIYWSGKASIRRQMTPALLKKMRAAGCTGMDYGLESGSAKVVRDMKKGFDLSTASRVIKDTHAAGIDVGLFLMAGFPTESEEDFNDTLGFVAQHKEHIHHVTPGWGAGLQAGSDIFINREKYGIYMKDDGWYSEHTTPEIRQDRVERLRIHCSSLELIVG
jgi:hypothetical protein